MTDDTGLSRRRFLQATGGAAAVATLAGCLGGGGDDDGNGGGNESTDGGGGGGQSTSTKGVKNADPGKTLRRILSGTITTLDPVAATDTSSGEIIQQVFDPLMNYPDAKTKVEPLLAEGYERSSDYTTYTFKLKKNAKFHNGKAVTAEDFVYSFERLAASKNSRRAYFILDSLGVKHKTTTTKQDGKEVEVYKSNSLAVKAVDKQTLEISLSSPFHSALAMLAYTSFAAVPKNIVGDVKGVKGKLKYSEFATKKPIGAGPFKFEMWKKGTEAEASRFEDYHSGKASIAGVHWQVIEDANAAYTQSMNKNADILSIPTSKYKPDNISIEKETDLGGKLGTYGPLDNGETANYYQITPLNTRYLGFNMDKVPKPVRQAFAYVMNHKLVVEEVFKGIGTPATHLTPPTIFPGGVDNYEKHGKKYPYDQNKTRLDKARQVMEKAGYGPDNKFSLQWTQYKDPTWTKLGKLLRDQLASTYINMKIQQAEFATMLQRGRNGNLEVYTLGWVADWPAPDNFLQLLNPPQTQTENPAPISYINWTEKNGSAAKKASKAYQTVLKNQDPTKKAQKVRNEAYLKIEEANWEDVGFICFNHEWGQRYWYDWVDIEPYGAMGGSRQMFKDVKIGKRS